MKTERVAAKCFVERLVCECGTEARFTVARRDGDKLLYVHFCPACSAFVEKTEQYPRLVWEAE